MDQAVTAAQKKYPWLSKIGPIKLTSGTGPYQSESYLPNADENPAKGNFTIQLRSAKAKENSAVWPDLIASEGMDYMARKDPAYQAMAKQFRVSMTQPQLDNARRRYKREKAQGETRSFEDFLKGAEIQEYVRGYLFPAAAPGWTGPKGEGGYTAEQKKLLDEFREQLNAS